MTLLRFASPPNLARLAAARPRRTLASWAVLLVASMAVVATLLSSATNHKGRLRHEP